jgi:guanine deaminase
VAIDVIAQDFLREAIRLSIENVESGRGGPFGAVVVLQGEIIGRGTNLVTATNDPTAHAEVVAIRRACQHRQNFSLDQCAIYTSCEPCPLCLAAIYWSRMERIYFAATCDDAAQAGFDDRVIYDELAKPISARQIPAINLLREEATVAFTAWGRQARRIEY